MDGIPSGKHPCTIIVNQGLVDAAPVYTALTEGQHSLAKDKDLKKVLDGTALLQVGCLADFVGTLLQCGRGCRALMAIAKQCVWVLGTEIERRILMVVSEGKDDTAPGPDSMAEETVAVVMRASAPVYNAKDPVHTTRELLRYMAAGRRVFAGVACLSLASDMSKVGHMGVHQAVLLEPRTAKAMWAAPQALDKKNKKSHHCMSTVLVL